MKKKGELNSGALSVVAGIQPLPQVNPEILDNLRNRKKKDISVDQLFQDIRSGDVAALSRGITLVESNRATHQQMARELIHLCLPFSGKSIRIGITGVPGAGKSTFIESIGNLIATEQNKLAVLAVDPSSGRSGGSILGDKTRMEKLASHPCAFIRPSPSGSSLGGVARKTRESIILCEAAGYKTVFVETVGVGQSEIAVHSMTDFFLLLIIPGAGDELQGMKRGIVEMADAIIVNKADGDNLEKAVRAKADYSAALHLLPNHAGNWIPQVITCSSREGYGIQEIWEMITVYKEHTHKNHYFYQRRKEQIQWWLEETIREQLSHGFYHHPLVKEKLAELKSKMEDNEMTPFQAASILLETFRTNSQT